MSRETVLPPVRRKWRPSLAMVVGLVLSIVLALPVAGMATVVVLSRSPGQLATSLADNGGKIAATGLVILLVTAVVGFLFWRLVSKPVYELIRWTEAVAVREPLPADAARHGTQELATLSESFAGMVAALRERSDYIETFTAHVSHELKSPLTAIAGAAELMRDAGDEMDVEARGRFLANIERDAARLSALVGRMREMARAETARARGRAEIGALADQLRQRFEGLDIQVRGGRASLSLPFDDALVILSHLADNALRHGARRMVIETAAPSGGTAVLVSNDGDPISPGNRAKIFEPFYTTRRESGGTGMGLVIVRALLKAHGGGIALDEAEAGTVFRIVLPG